MSTIEALPVSATAERRLDTPASWPEGVPRNGIELSQELDRIRSPHFDRRMELMQKDGPEFAEIKEIEDRLVALTYSARPFVDLQMARHIAEDLQRLRDLYGADTTAGRAVRGGTKTMHDRLEKASVVQPDAA